MAHGILAEELLFQASFLQKEAQRYDIEWNPKNSMFMNGTTTLGNKGSGEENETQIRKEYKAAKGDKVVKKQREDWSTGIHRQQGSECPACCRLSSHPKQSWC